MRDSVFKTFTSGRFRLLWFVYVGLIGVSFFTRVVLLVYSGNLADPSLINIAGIFFIGLVFDIFNAAFFTLPVLFYLWIVPERIFRTSVHQWILSLIFFAVMFILLFNAVAEYFFWDEFNTRFNFIAVDYLIYTTEVIGNIRESYPITWILAAITTVAALITYFSGKPLTRDQQALRFKHRTLSAAMLLALPLVGVFAVDGHLHNFSNNTYANELAGNGMYELFAAYRNNELDYERFYPHISDKDAIGNINQALHENFGIANTNQMDIFHVVTNDGPEKRLNVVLISIESFSAEFMALYGNSKNITPFLDSLADHSLVFTNLYATGTRTVRGLEALALSVPPTPGQSIVRRPHNEHLFTMATVLNQKGYDSKYIYGGYGYFDNMNYFFGNNGYSVIDRTALSEDEIDYENIWGVADENLFSLSIREIARSVHSGKKVFAHIMTTSNHRPYTYPGGRIDIPSHTGGDGAVKYTDYAVAKFIREASKTDWYDNTVFVITADHCASSAGKTELPIRKYLMPLLIFSPAHIQPRVEDRLMSQIDIAPTLFGLLNFSYASKFYGFDIFKLKQRNERAFISTYQSLGFIEGDSMVVLKPREIPEVRLVGNDMESTVVKKTTELNVVRHAISWYQSASYSFRHGAMAE